MSNHNKEVVTATLEQWYPDKYYRILWGNIKDDVRSRWADGTKIHTSFIPDTDLRTLKEGDLVVTLNSVYLLGGRYEPS